VILLFYLFKCNLLTRLPPPPPLLLLFPFFWLTDDFDDFCTLASKLTDESNGAPLFTVAHSRKLLKHDSGEVRSDDSLGVMTMNDVEGCVHEDDWQLL